MIDLYKKAFEIKKSGLWDIFLEEQIFSLRIKDTCPVFIQIRRNDDEEKTISVYYGEDTLDAVRRIMDMRPDTMADEEEVLHLEALIEGVELNYTSKAGLSANEAGLAAEAAGLCGIKPRGVGAYPKFSRLRKGQARAELDDPADVQIMQKAIDAAMWFINGKEDEVRLFIPTVDTRRFDMVAIEKSRGKYRQSFIEIPGLGKIKYPAGANSNEILQKRIKSMKKKGGWACRLVRKTTAVPWMGGEEMVLPSVIKTVSLEKSEYVDMMPVAFYETRTDVVLDKFMEAITEYGACPARICVMDGRTYALLKQWCKNCGIKLEQTDYLPELDIPEGIYIDGSDRDSFMEEGLAFMAIAIEFLMSVPDEMLKDFPEEISGIREIKKAGADILLTPELRLKFNRLLKKLDKLGL